MSSGYDIPVGFGGHRRIGTCSWKCDSWKGLVHDPDKRCRPDDYLPNYAKYFSTVEIDQWFWSLFPTGARLPDPSVVKRYAESVPGDFRFNVKAPNAIALFGHRILGAWLLDYGFALLFGIAFQYFTIAPMRGLGVDAGLKAALKPDTLSRSPWQLGMYGWMAIVAFAIFGHEFPKADPVFWFMTQIAMACGFLTSYPVNWWLLRRGIKEKM